MAVPPQSIDPVEKVPPVYGSPSASIIVRAIGNVVEAVDGQRNRVLSRGDELGVVLTDVIEKLSSEGVEAVDINLGGFRYRLATECLIAKSKMIVSLRNGVLETYDTGRLVTEEAFYSLLMENIRVYVNNLDQQIVHIRRPGFTTIQNVSITAPAFDESGGIGILLDVTGNGGHVYLANVVVHGMTEAIRVACDHVSMVNVVASKARTGFHFYKGGNIATFHVQTFACPVGFRFTFSHPHISFMPLFEFYTDEIWQELGIDEVVAIDTTDATEYQEIRIVGPRVWDALQTTKKTFVKNPQNIIIVPLTDQTWAEKLGSIAQLRLAYLQLRDYTSESAALIELRSKDQSPIILRNSWSYLRIERIETSGVRPLIEFGGKLISYIPSERLGLPLLSDCGDLPSSGDYVGQVYVCYDSSLGKWVLKVWDGSTWQTIG